MVGDIPGSLLRFTLFVAFPEVLSHQEDSCKENETKPSAASVVPSAYWKYDSVSAYSNCCVNSLYLVTMQSADTGNVPS